MVNAFAADNRRIAGIGVYSQMPIVASPASECALAEQGLHRRIIASIR